MVRYLINCHSLTRAQRMSGVLGRAGIPSSVVRTPGELAAEGCGYCLRVAEKNLSRALSVLQAAGFDKSKVLVYRDGEAAL